MAFLDPTINLMTKYSTCIQNPVTRQILLNIPVFIENRLLNLSSKESSTIHYEGNLQHSDGGPYHIETSPLICSANRWSGFYMVGDTVRN